MAVYRFRVTFEDYDEVSRDIDIKSVQTFQDLHFAIHQAINFNSDYSSSFYVSNYQGTKGEEIAYKPTQRKIDRGVTLMEKAKLSSFIDDPHQKFYYTSNFDRPFDFHVELIKILDDAPGVNYPVTAKSTGEPPKQFGNIYNPTVIPPTNEEFDFLNEMEYTPEDTEDFTEVREEGAAEEHEEESEEEDEFGGSFGEDEDEFPSHKGGSEEDY